MPGPDGGGTLGERMRRHSQACTSPLYTELLAGMAQDWEDGGPVAEVLRGWQDAPVGSFVQLRLLAGLHRLVLQRQAPHLATFHPSVGGRASPYGAWPVAREVVAAHVDTLRAGLHLAPQTNEVGRAGLNLLVDRYGVAGAGWSWGPHGSPVQLLGALDAEPGAVTARDVQVVSRRCNSQPMPSPSRSNLGPAQGRRARITGAAPAARTASH